MERQFSMTKSQRNGERWRKAKRSGDGVDLSIELHVPIPYQIERNKVKEQVTQKIRQKIDDLRELVEGSNGLIKVYHDIE